MAGRQKLSLDYETELPAQPVAGQVYNIAAKATMRLTGSVEPTAAAQAFDPQKTLQPRDLAHNIKENLRGWLRYAANLAIQQLLARPGADPLEPIQNPELARGIMIEQLRETFAAWTFEIEELAIEFEVTSSCLAALPENIRQRLDFMEGEADTAAAFGPFSQEVQENIDPFVDPATGTAVHLSAWARAIYTAHPERCRIALDPQSKLSPEGLGDALNQAVTPWLQYSVKQAAYNALFDAARTDPAVLADKAAMRQRANDLCREQLAGMGILHVDLQLQYEALDQPTAIALKLQLRGMAPTIAQDSEIAPPTPSPGPGGARPPIEEAVWRHQKIIMKQKPGIARQDLAREILVALDRDGYSPEERRRVGQQLGANASDLP